MPNSEVQVCPPEQYVAKQWAKVERMFVQGTNVYSLTHELQKLQLLCQQVARVMHTEDSVGMTYKLTLDSRLRRVTKTEEYAARWLDKLCVPVSESE